MSTASTIEQEMLALINAERTSRGLNPLKLETNLNEASEDHSTWMLNTDMFSHTGAGGSSATERMRDAGFDLSGSWRTGENIAWQSERGAPGISDDVAQLHQNLMNSPGHRANILNPEFEYIGIGIETGDMQGFDAVMVTQNFATTDGTVVLDNGAATLPAPTPPVAEMPVPDQPVTEAPDVAETPDPVPEIPNPAPETPDTDVTETTDPTPDTPDTDVTETDAPDAETPDVDVTETDDPAPETPDTDVTETEDPEAEIPETDVTETDDPASETPDTDEPETPGTDVVENDDPASDTPEPEVTDDGDPNDGCFDVAAFLAEIEAFIEALQSRLDEFAWDDDAEPSDSTDAFDLVGDAAETAEDEAPASDMTCDDSNDVFQFNFFTFDCMMDAA